MCSEDPRIPARSILELSRMLHSHRPLPHGPLYVAYLSSFPPLVFLPCSSLSFLLVNMPLPTPIRISTRKGNRRLLQMLHTKRDIISLFPSPPLSLSLSLIYRVMCNRIKRGEGGGFISIPRRVDFHSFRRIIHGAVSLFPQRYILNSFNLRTVYFHDLWPRSFPILLFYTNIKIIFHDIY